MACSESLVLLFPLHPVQFLQAQQGKGLYAPLQHLSSLIIYLITCAVVDWLVDLPANRSSYSTLTGGGLLPCWWLEQGEITLVGFFTDVLLPSKNSGPHVPPRRLYTNYTWLATTMPGDWAGEALGMPAERRACAWIIGSDLVTSRLALDEAVVALVVHLASHRVHEKVLGGAQSVLNQWAGRLQREEGRRWHRWAADRGVGRTCAIASRHRDRPFLPSRSSFHANIRSPNLVRAYLKGSQ